MAIRFVTGSESGDFLHWNSQPTGSRYSIQVVTTNPAHGAEHIRAIYDGGASPSSTGGYTEREFIGAAAPVLYPQAPINQAGLLLPSSGLTECEISFECASDVRVTGLSTHYVLQVRTNTAVVASVVMGNNGGNRDVGVRGNGPTTGTVSLGLNLTSDVSYRFRLRIKIVRADSGGIAQGYASLFVYNTSSSTLVGYASAGVNLGVDDNVNVLRFGAIPLIAFLTTTGTAYHFDIDSIQVNDSQDTGNGVGIGDPGVCQILAANAGTADSGSGGTHAEWANISGSARNELEVDEYNAGAVDTTTYNHSTLGAPGLERDTYTKANPTFTSSGPILKAMIVAIRHRSHDGASNDIFHRGGIYDTAAAALLGMGSSLTVLGPAWAWDLIVIQEDSGGNALVNADYDNAEIAIWKYIDLFGINAKRVTAVWLEAADDSGVTPDTVEELADTALATGSVT